MKKKLSLLNNENGSAVVMALIFLMALTFLGFFAITTSTIEIQISGNDKINKMVFYAADSGIHYVAVDPGLYGSNNITVGANLDFPVDGSPNIKYQLSNSVQFGGNVAYLEKNPMPLGSGYSAGLVFAIDYQIESNSTGPNNGENNIEAGFYRIGF